MDINIETLHALLKFTQTHTLTEICSKKELKAFKVVMNFLLTYN